MKTESLAVRSVSAGIFFAPEHNSPLSVFRFIFGFLLFIHFVTSITSGLVFQNYVQPPFTFPYIGFEFLRTLAGEGMYFLFGLLAFLSLLVMIGAWYRVSIVLLTIGWFVIYLMQKVGYNNHYYLILLICLIMSVMPANRSFSVDVKRGAVQQSTWMPRYHRLLFIFQVAVVYFYAALSKLNADWLSGKFMSIQLSRWSRHPKLGFIYGQDWFPQFICYGGLLFDLLIIPLMLTKRTRTFAFIIAVAFHLFNAFTFRIGIFPFLSIALLIFFFDPVQITKIFLRPDASKSASDTLSSPSSKKWIQIVLMIYVIIQIALPLRYLLYPGNVFWTEEGYRLSWKMMLRTKSGKMHFKIKELGSSEVNIHEPISQFSATQVMWIAGSPDMIWQYAQKIKQDYHNRGSDVQVFAISLVSLNREPFRPIVDSTVDLANVKWQVFRHSRWIVSQ